MNTKYTSKSWILRIGFFFATLLLAATLACIEMFFRVSNQMKHEIDIIDKPAYIDSLTFDVPELTTLQGAPDNIDENDDIEVMAPVDEAIFRQPTIEEDVLNVLVIGTDVNDNDKKTGRSDVMMLLTYDRESRTVHMTSFLRDIWICIPGRGWDRLNAAYAYGGTGMLINTINENFDLDIQNYVLIDFDGLISVVDILGGVEVRLTKAEVRHINEQMREDEKLPEKEGTYLLNGKQVLIHCRNRRSTNGDFDRTQRQRDIMVALFNRAKRENSLGKLAQLILTTAEHVKTNIKINTIIELGLEAITSDDLTIEQLRVPFDDTWNYASINGRSVIAIDLDYNRDALKNEVYQ